MATTIKELFLETVDKALQTAESIIDPAQKAGVYAQLATAMAPLVERNKSMAVEDEEALTGKESLTKGNNKSKAKGKGKSKKDDAPVAKKDVEPTPFEMETAVPEEVIEEIQQDIAEQAEPAVDEPTDEPEAQSDAEEFEQHVHDTNIEEEFSYLGDEAVEMLKADKELVEALRFYNGIVEGNDASTINYYIALWTQNELQSMEDINFDNIKGFVTFMYEQMEETEE